MTKVYQEYESPLTEVLELSTVQVICDSPDPGENEEVGYEDWVL